MTAFKTAYNQTLSHEGSFSNDPRDHGGMTYQGISRVKNPQWEGWAVVDSVISKLKIKTEAQIAKALQKRKDLPEMVEGFYFTSFWQRLLLDELEEEAIAIELYEQAVNQGAATAARHLQYALNLLNRNGKDYQDIKVDGVVGKRTLAAFKAYMQTASLPTRSRERNTHTLLKILNALQFDRYRDFCAAHPDQEVFIYGWINRV